MKYKPRGDSCEFASTISAAQAIPAISPGNYRRLFVG